MQVKNSVNEQTSDAKKTFANIETRSFVIVVLLLGFLLAISGILSYVIPQGSFLRDENGAIIEGSYTLHEDQEGISLWRVITAPARVFVSEDSLTIIMISVFLLVMSGIFNLLEKTNGTKVVISRLMSRLADNGAPVVCFCVLTFMLFGSFFGMFEELVTLLPLIVAFMLSMKMDTMTGLGACLLAACFGFSAAITNPFSVGLAASIADVPVMSGVWLRLLFFAIIYFILCAFLMNHLKRIEKNPELSPSYDVDNEKRKSGIGITEPCERNAENDRIFKVFCTFFVAQIVVLVVVASIRSLSGLAIPILAASFLIGGIAAGLIVANRKRDVFLYIVRGAKAMSPAILMIALASSIKLVMTEGDIIDSIMNYVINMLDGKSRFGSILLVYFLILLLQVFIGSSSAKLMLVFPIVLPICQSIGISSELVILAYCMADGFSDVILPTNPVLLVGLSMANIPYTKWFKWTWRLQGFVFLLTIVILLFATLIGY